MYSPWRYLSYIFWKNQPLQLTFFVTGRCNARCPFCFYLKAEEQLETDHQELSVEEIEKISSSLGRLLWVLFSGGEPYLREDIVKISRIIYENNKPVVLTYPTNGLLPEVIKEKTEQILRRCQKSIVVVKLSLDGLNDRLDVLRGVPGSFEKIMQTYQGLGELLGKYPNLELGVNTVFCSANQDNMEEIIEFVNGLDKIRTHTISLVRGRLQEKKYQDVDLEKYRDAIEILERNLKNKTGSIYRFKGACLKAAQDILQRRLIYQTMRRQQRIIPCYAGRLNIVLTETGDVYPCESFDQPMGNAGDFNYNVREMLHSARAKEVISKIRKDGCYCSHECYFMTNILFNPRLLADMTKQYLLS